MKFFKKNKENQIENKKLKEMLANTALSTLKQGEDYEKLSFTKVEFGYLFMIKGHGLEALYKVITDKGTFYFAAQVEKVMRININDNMYKETIETFLELHNK